ncbi:MAG: hypothetical protein AAGA03_19140 [Planctomycetota bacterium]
MLPRKGVGPGARAKTEDEQMYDRREKAQRDYEWAISGARQEGREEGLEKGREEGREKGRSEGKLAGQIQLLQQLLGDTQSSETELLRQDAETLTIQLAELQKRLRARPS